ncbi:hypothetical protein HDV00_006395 [Rhizophlyctis rosea]|nr:hypothetical protein HDV00_006395 [Rhizophlyctis rosea]
MSPLRKHIPLIKFLGPRAKLQHSSPSATPTPQPTASSSPSSSSARASTSSSGVRILTYDAITQLPKRLQRKGLSEKEIAAIDAGGADFILTGA